MSANETVQQNGAAAQLVNRVFSMPHIGPVAIVVFVACIAVFAFGEPHLHSAARSLVMAFGTSFSIWADIRRRRLLGLRDVAVLLVSTLVIYAIVEFLPRD